MSTKDRTKNNRKRTDQYDEESHRAYRISKQREQNKSMKVLERALRSKDYQKLSNLDDIY